MKRQKKQADKETRQGPPATDQRRDDDDEAVTINGVAQMLDVSPVTVWRMVRDGTLPTPFYPRSRQPRWSRGDLREAREKMRMTPREAKAKAREAKLAAQETGSAAD